MVDTADFEPEQETSNVLQVEESETIAPHVSCLITGPYN